MSDTESMERGLMAENVSMVHKPPHKVWPKCFTITVIVTLVTASLLLGIWVTVSEFQKLKSNQEESQQKIQEVVKAQQQRDNMISKLKHKIHHLQREVHPQGTVLTRKVDSKIHSGKVKHAKESGS
ncbi:unnamed protein product [Owenia fusiformis]|uniref:Uncharacterized protein n=1 Tax=Owenia fusiformis TaxID=6347 RepID=A0A8S4NGE7_OWEFU|nr:unnamed protein product [Owenia fusiformis]